MTESKPATQAASDQHELSLSFGLHRLGFATLSHPWIALLVFAALAVIAGLGLNRLKVDDSLSELFRTNTADFRRFEEVDKRFPSTEYDVLVVVEGKDLLKKPQIEANIYDKEIQSMLGFYSLCSYVLDKCSNRSVYLGVCPEQFALYLKLRAAVDQSQNKWEDVFRVKNVFGDYGEYKKTTRYGINICIRLCSNIILFKFFSKFREKNNILTA